MEKMFCGNFRYARAGLIALIGLVSLFLGACADDSHYDRFDFDTDPTEPWTAAAIADAYLTTDPFADKHDGGWVYSAREDRLYAIYGNDNSGRTLYRIDHINGTSEVATTFVYGRHGSHPVIDDSGTYIYMPPSQETNQLERYNTETDALETLAPAPAGGTFSHGAWKNDKLWIVLNDSNLYSYDPATDTWSAALHDFGNWGNVAASGPSSSLIYVIVQPGTFFSYDVTDDTVTALPDHPNGFNLGGNNEFTWFGSSVGFIYAAENYGGAPAIFDIANGVWQDLTDPKAPNSWAGHATYDTERQRLYVTGSANAVWYYEY